MLNAFSDPLAIGYTYIQYYTGIVGWSLLKAIFAFDVILTIVGDDKSAFI